MWCGSCSKLWPPWLLFHDGLDPWATSEDDPFLLKAAFFSRVLYHSNVIRRPDLTLQPAQAGPKLTFLVPQPPWHMHAPPHSAFLGSVMKEQISHPSSSQRNGFPPLRPTGSHIQIQTFSPTYVNTSGHNFLSIYHLSKGYVHSNKK